MATEHAKAVADRHKAACVSLAASTTNPEIKTLALALADANLWIDAGYTDMQGALQRIASLEASLAKAQREVKDLQQLVQQSNR